SAARGVSLKHCVLDFHPEYEPLFEPGGWNWCLSNPETQRVLRELVAEMHEDFGNPPFFHIGCDEAQPPTCAECRKVPYGELVCKHITGIAQFIKSRGAQAMMWHDMLIDKDDPRWKGFVAMGSKATATLADTLPRDVIVCDWQYSYGDMKETRADWPTIGYFKEKGFRVCGAPWRNFNAMKPMADYIARVGGFGILETTWNHLRGRDWRDMYVYGAGAAWGTSPVGAPPLYDSRFARALRFVGHDMHISDKRDTGIYDEEIPELWWPMW
ncbi:MAG: family 20 glycosylhydrolase, partial [Kiritimatiellae bacterium]|nr:family 20 glycosylhydrolase [Kiritimatiellia bacterium]